MIAGGGGKHNPHGEIFGGIFRPPHGPTRATVAHPAPRHRTPAHGPTRAHTGRKRAMPAPVGAGGPSRRSVEAVPRHVDTDTGEDGTGAALVGHRPPPRRERGNRVVVVDGEHEGGVVADVDAVGVTVGPPLTA